MSLVTLENASIRHSGNPVLTDVNFSITKGEIVTLVGPNGSGKSTFLRSIIGALQPSSGRVIRSAGLRIGYVPQKLHIDPTLPITVERFLRLPGGIARDACARALARAGVPDLSRRQMSALSGGQMQRIALARALYDDPVIVILDEPNSNLDNEGSVALNAAIKQLKAEGRSVLIMAHRPAAIQECDLLLVVDQGNQTAFGPKDDVLRQMVVNHQNIQKTAAARKAK